MLCSIGFVGNPGFVSETIEAATRAPVSHTYIVFDELPYLGHLVFEASWNGFRANMRGRLGRILTEIPVDIDAQGALSTCQEWLQTPYAYAGVLLGEPLVLLGRALGRRWPNPFAGPHTMFCSEAVVYLLQKHLLPGVLKERVVLLDPRATDPGQLLGVMR